MFFGGGFPGFGGGGGGGGGRRGGHSHGGEPDEPIDNTSLYKVLGVEKDATTAEISKAYKKLAMKVRPATRPWERHFLAAPRRFRRAPAPESRGVGRILTVRRPLYCPRPLLPAAPPRQTRRQRGKVQGGGQGV